jgi:hypothetical protein
MKIRLLKAHDLITSPAYVVIKAADEFKDKTTAINQRRRPPWLLSLNRKYFRTKPPSRAGSGAPQGPHAISPLSVSGPASPRTT